MLIDSHFVDLEQKVDARQVTLEMHKTIMEKIGKPVVVNICMLGALIGLTNVIKKSSVLKVLKAKVPVDLLDMNKKAFDIGLNLIKK